MQGLHRHGRPAHLRPQADNHGKEIHDGRTLQQYRDSGRIAFYRLDGKILYDEDDVRDFLALSYRPKFEDWGT